MKNEKLNEKQIILRKLVNSGINVTPSILEFFLNLENPIKKIDKIIKDTSFIADFNSHLTKNILKKISDKEIQNVLRRTLLKDEIESNEEIISFNNNEDKNSSKVFEKSKDIYIDNSMEGSIKEIANVGDSNEISPYETYSINKDDGIFKSKFINQNKIKLFETTRSNLKFNPIAKDYHSNYKILKDPTGKLYTNGEYQDFYDLTLDKFNQLRTLMRKKPEVVSAHNINNIVRLSNKVEVSVLGLVSEIHKTKNGNFFITLEDLTGTINILIKNDAANQDNVKIAERTLSDQLIYIEGTYSPAEKGKGCIIYSNYISKIDIPTDFQPRKSPDPLSIALISDTHIGSREFEEPLLKRFINFLKGKIGDKVSRDIAGRVKYLIINGDLVDGIGVYPSQYEDLTIPDIYNQYKKAAELFSEIPDYIEVFYSPGNHEPVRNALPRPAVPKKYIENLIEIGFKSIGNPSVIQTHNVNTLVYHGDSILDINMLIPNLENNNPIETMKELLICRHLAPTFGRKTQLAPTNKDWLVIDTIPEIFHTGHVHINGMGKYRNVNLINSGCFQAQTDFMKSFGINPTPGIVPIIELDTFKTYEINLRDYN